MVKAFQVQLLTWLAALAVFGAIARPTFDTLLFAAAFALGTVLLRLREDGGGARGRVIGEALGVLVAFGAAAARACLPTIALVPARLDARTLLLSAIVPATSVLFAAIAVLRGRRARSRRLDV